MNNYLTKFEKTRVLGQRSHQIATGAPPLVDITGLDDAFSIALKELEQGKIPFKIIRAYPDGDIEELSVSQMRFITD